jgi:hypothetical protein
MDLFLNRLGFFLRVFELNQIKKAGWQPGPTGQSTQMGLTKPARPSPAAPSLAPLSVGPNPNPPWRSRIADELLARLRRAPARSATALWRICSASSRASSWPRCFIVFASNRRHRRRAPPSGSRPCGLIYSGKPRWSSCPSSTVLAVSPSSPRRLDGCLQPRRHRHAVLGRSAMSTMPPPSSSQPQDGGLAATTVAALLCRRHGLLPCSSGSTPVRFFSSSLFLCTCYGGLASEPGMLAYVVAVPCCCCCSAQACAAATVVLLELHC